MGEPMEELFVYALLYSEGFDVWPLYADKLDRLFMEDMENEAYLTLEGMAPKEAVLHTLSIMEGSNFDTEYFGKILMRSLLRIYEDTDIAVFAGKMYSLWNKLPRDTGREEPFLTLCYADDCLSYHDEAQCRKLYEKAMRYYDQTGHQLHGALLPEGKGCGYHGFPHPVGRRHL